MIKARKISILTALAALVLAAISAALLFMVAPKRPAKADGETETVVSEYPDPTGWTSGTVTAGDTIAEKYIILSYSHATNATLKIVNNDDYYNIAFNFDALEGIWYITFINNHCNTYIAQIDLTAEVVAELINIVGGNDFYVYIPSVIEGIYEQEDISAYTFDTSDSNITIVYAPTQPEEPDDPGEPEQPNEPTETPTEEKKFDLAAWLINAGDSVSEWLGENVGIATTGSTVLIVGAIIIIIIATRRRK